MEKGGNPRLARYAWGVLAYNILVILWGAVVRVTGSGAGCGNHWPSCNGEIVPQSPAMHTLVEFTHRAMTGLDGPLVLLLAVWAFRAFPKRHPARTGVVLSLFFLLTESLIGAALVKFDYVAANASAARGVWLSIHLINTLMLVASLALTAWWSGGRPRARVAGRPAILAGVSVAVFLLLGVTGAIAALGDTLFPASSVAAGFAQDLDPAAHLFVKLRAMHPMVAALAAAWLLFFAITTPRDLRGYGRALMVALAAQMVAGVTNWLLLAPAWLQIGHLLLADVVWVALVLLGAARMAGAGAEKGAGGRGPGAGE